MSVTTKVIRTNGVSVPAYVSGDNKDVILAAVQDGFVQIYKPVLEMSNERKRTKLIDTIVSKAKHKHGVKDKQEYPKHELRFENGELFKHKERVVK